MAFTGNMLWAHSAFASTSKAQERSMALVGSSFGTVGGNLDLGKLRAAAEAREALDSLERQLLAGVDTLSATFLRELEAAGLEDAPPSEAQAWVWRRLFPDYAWPVGQTELEQAIAARYRAA